jgi:hypothetical protein
MALLEWHIAQDWCYLPYLGFHTVACLSEEVKNPE